MPARVMNPAAESSTVLLRMKNTSQERVARKVELSLANFYLLSGIYSDTDLNIDKPLVEARLRGRVHQHGRGTKFIARGLGTVAEAKTRRAR